MSEKLRADRDVAMAVAVNDEGALLYMHAARRKDLAGPDLLDTAFDDGLPKGESKTGPVYMGIPLTEEARRMGLQYVTMHQDKYVMFTAMSTITPNMGQSNYIAANAAL